MMNALDDVREEPDVILTPCHDNPSATLGTCEARITLDHRIGLHRLLLQQRPHRAGEALGARAPLVRSLLPIGPTDRLRAARGGACRPQARRADWFSDFGSS